MHRGSSSKKYSNFTSGIPRSIPRQTPKTLRANNYASNSQSAIGRISQRSYLTPTSTPLSISSHKQFGKSPIFRKTRPIDDKEWLKCQWARIRAYLDTHPDFDSGQFGKLKPMGATIFILICNFFLQDIHADIELTMENVKDALPDILKMFEYPLTTPSSFFKTVSTLHSWPHVVSILSWLLDFSEHSRSQVNTPLSVSQNNADFLEPCATFYLKRYALYALKKDDTVEDEAFKACYERLLGYDEKRAKELEAIVRTKMEKRQAQLSKLNETRAQVTQIDDGIKQLQKSTEEIQSECEKRSTTLKNQIDSLLYEKEQYECKLKSIEDRHAFLCTRIASQKYSVNEKRQKEEMCKAQDEMVKHLTELLRTEELKEESQYTLIMKKKTEISKKIPSINLELAHHVSKLPSLDSLRFVSTGELWSTQTIEYIDDLAVKYEQKREWIINEAQICKEKENEYRLQTEKQLQDISKLLNEKCCMENERKLLDAELSDLQQKEKILLSDEEQAVAEQVAVTSQYENLKQKVLQLDSDVRSTITRNIEMENEFHRLVALDLKFMKNIEINARMTVNSVEELLELLKTNVNASKEKTLKITEDILSNILQLKTYSE